MPPVPPPIPLISPLTRQECLTRLRTVVRAADARTADAPGRDRIAILWLSTGALKLELRPLPGEPRSYFPWQLKATLRPDPGGTLIHATTQPRERYSPLLLLVVLLFATTATWSYLSGAHGPSSSWSRDHPGLYLITFALISIGAPLLRRLIRRRHPTPEADARREFERFLAQHLATEPLETLDPARARLAGKGHEF